MHEAANGIVPKHISITCKPDNKIMICNVFQMHGAHKPRDWEQGSAK